MMLYSPVGVSWAMVIKLFANIQYGAYLVWGYPFTGYIIILM